MILNWGRIESWIRSNRSPTLSAFQGAWPSLHTAFSGRCFILGNGPSLREHNLASLQYDIIFTVNRGYLAREFGLKKPTFHVVSDPHTYEAYAAEISAADVGLRFYRDDVAKTRSYSLSETREFAIPFSHNRDQMMYEGHFTENISLGTSRNGTVVLDAAQIAIHLGFREIYVMGVDLTAPAAGPTHFFGSGKYEQSRLGEMDHDNVNRSFAVARQRIEALGGTFRNAGIGGNLTALDRVAFADLF